MFLNTMLIISLGLLAGAIYCIFFSNKYLWWFIPKEKLNHIRNNLPFSHVLEDNETIVCTNGSLVRVIKLEGINWFFRTVDEIKKHVKIKKNWLDELAKVNANIRFITTREKVPYFLEGHFPNKILKLIHDTWMQVFKATYRNEHYIVITVSYKRKKGKDNFVALGQLKHIIAITYDLLYEYKPLALTHNEFNSPLLSFWAKIINGENFIIAANKKNFTQYIVGKTIMFEPQHGIITLHEGINKKFIQAISLMRWGEQCNNELLLALQRLNGESIILHHIQGQASLEAITKLRYQAKQAALGIGGYKAKEEYDIAIKHIEDQEETFFNYQFTIFVMGDSLEYIHCLVDQVKQVFRQYGAIPIVETYAIEWLWRSLFPTQDQLVYTTRLLSSSLAHWLALDYESYGKLKCDWGEGPVRFFKTASVGVYALQLHANEDKESLAHSLIIAPAGSGKTTMFQHLIGGALRFKDMRAYIFDRLNGTKIFTESIGGEYIDLTNNLLPINPLVCEDSAKNRAFLFQFFSLIAEAQNEEEREELIKAIDIIFEFPQHKRVLTYLIDIIFSPKSRLKRSLLPWVNNNPLAKWFNGITFKNNQSEATDALNVGNSFLVGFEMTDIQKNVKVSSAMIYYIMHKIRSLVKDQAFGHLIFIDEARPMLSDDVFRQYVAELFLEHRKLRGSINICFQDVHSLLDSGVGHIILEQCATFFLFPNVNATREHYKALSLTDFEWDYIKGNLLISKFLKHSVLVKKNQESVILDVDLSGLGNLIKLYRSGSEAVKLAKMLQQQYGGNLWVEHYLNC